MKTYLLNLSILLALVNPAWCKPAAEPATTFTSPDGKTITIQRQGGGDKIAELMTKALRGSQNGKFTLRLGSGQVIEFEKKGDQVTFNTPRGQERETAENFLNSFLKARDEGMAKACESNLKNIATAIEMYSSDHQGKFPTNLKELVTGKYFSSMPTCPSTHKDVYSSTYKNSGKSYTFYCSGSHAGRTPGHPAYDSKTGLIR